MIQLIGPGGAGKSTIGRVLADRLDVPFIDLDLAFTERLGDIGEYLGGHGYAGYARANVETYRCVLASCSARGVLALSSGVMTYPSDVHAAYPRARDDLARSPSTFVLLPSLDLETCVAEIVRRQLSRPFARTPAREEAVIRQRFAIYVGLPSIKIETMRPPAHAAADIHATSLRVGTHRPSL